MTLFLFGDGGTFGRIYLQELWALTFYPDQMIFRISASQPFQIMTNSVH